jgi:hypothetical protein
VRRRVRIRRLHRQAPVGTLRDANNLVAAIGAQMSGKVQVLAGKVLMDKLSSS